MEILWPQTYLEHIVPKKIFKILVSLIKIPLNYLIPNYLMIIQFGLLFTHLMCFCSTAESIENEWVFFSKTT